MNRWKGNAVTQITLDEDFIVPDTLEDMEQVILEQAHIQGENVKTQEEKITVKGKLEFQVLYRKENGGLETLGGNIPFEETVNVPGFPLILYLYLISKYCFFEYLKRQRYELFVNDAYELKKLSNFPIFTKIILL